MAENLKQFMDDHYLGDVCKGMHGLEGKPYALFCSHGSGGRGREMMLRLFTRIGMQVGDLVAPLRQPSPEVLERCRGLGRALAGAAQG
jgi:flavorubredoxin